MRRPLDLHHITSRNLAAAVLPSVAGGPLGFQRRTRAIRRTTPTESAPVHFGVSYSNTSWPYDPRLGRQLGNFPIAALFVSGAHFDRAIEINLDGYFNLSLLR